MRLLLIAFVLIDFALYTAYVCWEVGYLGIWQAGLSSTANLQILLDLIIAASLVCVWIHKDALQRGKKPWPWIIATALGGSLVPLLYLFLREMERNKQAQLLASH